MRRVLSAKTLAIACVFLAASGIARATRLVTVAVTTDVDASNCTLRDAITTVNTNAATGGCTIVGTTANYVIDMTGLSGTITLGSALPTVNPNGGKNLTINGPGVATLAIDGNKSACTSAPCGFTMLTISASVSTQSVTITDLTLQNGKLLNSTSVDAAGLKLTGGSAILNRSRVTGMVTSSTGGLAAGAGLYVTTSAAAGLFVANSSIDGNSASSTGSGAEGAGIFVQASTATLVNTTITGNTTSGSNGYDAAAEVLNSATLKLINCTISANSSSASGNVTAEYSSTLSMVNSIVSKNSTPDFQVIVFADSAGTSGGNNVVGITLGLTFGGTDQTGVFNPKLLALADNGGTHVPTMAFDSGSPAVNAGDNTTCQAAFPSGANGKDARNKNRRTGVCDIGAYEAQADHLVASPASTNTAAGRLKAPVSGDFGNLTATVQDVSNNDLNGVPVAAWTRGGVAGPDLSPVPVGGTSPVGTGATAGQDVESGTNNSTSGDYAYEANTVSGVGSAKRAKFFLRNYTKASATASGPTQDCSGQPAQLTLVVNSLSTPAPVSTNVYIDWDDGSGTDTESAASLPATFHRNVFPTNAGPGDLQHNYSVTFSDDNGAGSVTGNPVSINVHPLPTAVVGPGSSICAGQTSFQLSGSGGTSCSWSPSTGLDNDSICNPTATPSTTTTYTLTVTDGNGCSSTNNPTVLVTVNTPPPTPTITRSGPTTICSGSSVTLSGPTGFAGYQWYKNNVAIGSATNQTYAATATGHYSIRVTDGNGCYATSSAMAVTMLNNPVPVITPVGSTTVACGHTVTLNATSGLSSYRWYKNSVLIGGATTHTYVATTSGSYTVNVTNASGCSGTSAAVVVTVSCP